MSEAVTDKSAGVGAAGISDHSPVWGDHVDVKIHQSFAADARRRATVAVSGVANRTGESYGVDMERVPACPDRPRREAGVRDDVAQIVALCAQRIRATGGG